MEKNENRYHVFDNDSQICIWSRLRDSFQRGLSSVNGPPFFGTSSYFVKDAVVDMAGNTVESHTDSELVSGGISRVNTLATWAISTGHHCLFHAPWVDYNRSMSRRKEGETKVLPFRITNRDRIKYPIE